MIQIMQNKNPNHHVYRETCWQTIPARRHQKYHPQIRQLEFPSACKSHNVFRIMFLPALMKSFQMITIHRLQWYSKQRIIDISRGILQVLVVPNAGLEQQLGRKTHSLNHKLVGRCVGPTEVEVRWEDSKRTVWQVRGWVAMGEKVWLEWLGEISEGQAVVVSAEPQSISTSPYQNEQTLHPCNC